MIWLLFVVTVLGPEHVALEARAFPDAFACQDAAGRVRAEAGRVAWCERREGA